MIKPTKLMQEIESTAYSIKFGNLEPNLEQKEYIKLVDMLLQYKKLGQFSRTADTYTVLMEDVKGFDEYSGNRFNGAFKTAMNMYGMKDQQTSKMLPFLMLFNKYWNARKANKIKEFLEDEDGSNQEAKRDALKEILAMESKKYCVKIATEDLKSVANLNQTSIKRVTDKYGFSDDDAQYLQDIASCNYVAIDHSPEADKNSDTDDGDMFLSGPALAKRQDEQEQTLMLLFDMLDRVNENVSSKKARKVFNMVSTLYIEKHTAETTNPLSYSMTQGYIDRDILDYVNEYGEGYDEIDTVCQYTGKTREWIQKLLSQCKSQI